MAIVKSGNMKGQVGKLAGNVYYSAMGETRSRELAGDVHNPRTPAQMKQRVRWANLVNFYRANSTWMKYAFETKTQRQSEYNKLMSLNVAASPIYLTKQQAAAGSCVVYPYMVTQGSLPSIEFVDQSEWWLTNILLPGAYIISSATTVAAFTEAVLPLNPALRAGDQLSFIRITQQSNADTGFPYIVVRKYELVLDRSNNRLFQDYMPIDYIKTNESSSDCRLIVNNSTLPGAFALILSRTTGGKTYVSSQSLIIANAESIIAAYSSQAALNAAVASYGEGDDAFLSSNYAYTNSQAPALPTPYSLSDGENTWLAGQVVGPIALANEQELYVQFSADIPTGSVDIALQYYKDGRLYDLDLENTQRFGNSVQGSMPTGSSGYTGIYLSRVIVRIGDSEYVLVFTVPNEATIGGLE